MASENKISKQEKDFKKIVKIMAEELVNNLKEESATYGELNKKILILKLEVRFNDSNFLSVVDKAIEIIEKEKNAITLKE